MIISFIKDIIAPKECYFCQTEWHFFCPTCYKKISKIPPICYVCKKKSPWFILHNECREYLDGESLMIMFSYGDVKKLIKDSKYYAKKDILEDIWQYMWQYLWEFLDINKKEDYIILPVPMSFWRKSKRWYNHADVLAKHVSKSSWISYNTKVLKRVKNTLQQSKLTRNQRLSNLGGAFQINEKYKHLLANKNIILIDDVVSTWVTFSEILSVIDTNNVKGVYCLAIASDTKIFD